MFKKIVELFVVLIGDSVGFELVSLWIGIIWGFLGLFDLLFFVFFCLFSVVVWGEDFDFILFCLSVYVEDVGDFCYVKDCGWVIVLFMFVEWLNYCIYNVLIGWLVGYGEVVVVINVVVLGVGVIFLEGCNFDWFLDIYFDIIWL